MMGLSPLLVLHICAGTVGLLSGAAATVFRKGGSRHRISGDVFVISMLLLAVSGAYLGFAKHQTLNGLMGILTFYLVGTAWLTARRKDGETDRLDLGVLGVPLAAGAGLVTYGFAAAKSVTGLKDGYPAAAYFIFGSIALLFAAGDIRMLLRGGVSGTQRIARHLRRMCVAMFIAAGSFFLGQQQVFPAWLRKTNLLFIPAILPLAVMIFWLVRVSRSKRAKGVLVPKWEEKARARAVSAA